MKTKIVLTVLLLIVTLAFVMSVSGQRRFEWDWAKEQRIVVTDAVGGWTFYPRGRDPEFLGDATVSLGTDIIITLELPDGKMVWEGRGYLASEQEPQAAPIISYDPYPAPR